MKQLLLLMGVLWLSVKGSAQSIDVIVAADGSGQYRTVQAAIDAAGTNLTAPFRILIKKGKYAEKVTIPSNKPFIYLIGESVADVVITWNDYSGKPMPGGGTFGTSNSATVTVNATDFTAVNITFENTTGDAPQALAINVNNDRCAFKNCRFLGGQDTVLTNRAGARQYFTQCYIDGVVDFIFGNAIAVFDSCVVYARDRADNLSGSYITAANTPAGQTYGYVFRHCILPSNRGVTSYVLGRPWQNDGTTSPASNTKVVFINTKMGQTINSAGWATWNANTNTALILYAENKTQKLDGTPYDVSRRVAWSVQLSDSAARPYMQDSVLFGTWSPCVALAEACALPAGQSLAIANFKAKKGSSTVPTTLTWNACWGQSGIRYELWRSINTTNQFTKIYETTAVSDTAINFGTTDAIPAPNNKFFYIVKVFKTGFTDVVSDTIEISSVPTLSLSTTGLSTFLQGVGLPSAPQSYTVSGINLADSVLLRVSAPFEVSKDGNSWTRGPLSIAPSATVLAPTTIQVRLNAGAVGTYMDSIAHTSPSAATLYLKLNGTVQADPLPVSKVLLHFPLTDNNIDSALARAPGMLESVATSSRLTVSDGTTVTAVPAYSALLGQAFAPSANGLWTTANGGPGGNLSRLHYVEYKIKGTANSRIRVDSIVFNASYYATQSNTKMAIVYSKTGFVSDSINVSGGGIGPGGTPLTSTTDGAFTTPLIIPQDNTGTVSNFRVALNGASGVTLALGETLTVRAYFSCGSTSTGRYAKLKDIIFKGLVTNTTPVSEPTPSVLRLFPNPTTASTTLEWPESTEQGHLMVFDVLGRLHHQQTISRQTTQTVLETAQWPSGLYQVRCTWPSGKWAAMPLHVQH